MDAGLRPSFASGAVQPRSRNDSLEGERARFGRSGPRPRGPLDARKPVHGLVRSFAPGFGARAPLQAARTSQRDGICLAVAVVALRQPRRVQRRNSSHSPLDLREAFAPLDAALLVAARRVLPREQIRAMCLPRQTEIRLVGPLFIDSSGETPASSRLDWRDR